jgi:hypothetical protein
MTGEDRSGWVRDKKRLRLPGLAYEVPEDWRTPATDYPLRKNKVAELRRSTYKPGVYIMEGVQGYPVFTVQKSIPVTSLFIHGNQWMLDDPLHWVGMKAIAEASEGKVLVVGLGLGLVERALLENPRVTSVTVYEREPEVIRLMKPNVPGITIELHDFWQVQDYSGWDTIILDIWTTTEHDRHTAAIQMAAALAHVEVHGHRGKTFIWGTRDPKLNPAIKPMAAQSQRTLELLTEVMNRDDERHPERA